MPEQYSAMKRELLPGVSAYTWSRLQFWWGIVAGVVGGLVVIETMLNLVVWRRGVPYFPVLFGTAIVILAATWTIRLAFPRRKAAEERAGYTTLFDGRLNLDLVHPRTGAVLRPAGAGGLSREQWKAALRGQDRPSFSTGATTGIANLPTQRPQFEPLNRVRRLLARYVSIVVGAVALVAIFVAVARFASGPGGALPGGRIATVAFVVVFVGGVAALFIAIAVGFRRSRRRSAARIDAVRARRPGAYVFVGGGRAQLAEVLGLVAPIPFDASWFVVALTASGIEFWTLAAGTEPSFVVPWSQVRRVYPGTGLMQTSRQDIHYHAVHVVWAHESRTIDFGIGVGPLKVANEALDQFATHVTISASA